MSRSTLIGIVLLAVTAAGCSSSRDGTVEQVADDFRSALRSEDGDAACKELSDPVRFELELSSGATCEVELRVAELPADGKVRDVTVSGTAAQVRYEDDVIFLSEFDDGWKIIGAGCLSRSVGPYDCQVGG